MKNSIKSHLTLIIFKCNAESPIMPQYKNGQLFAVFNFPLKMPFIWNNSDFFSFSHAKSILIHRFRLLFDVSCVDNNYYHFNHGDIYRNQN